MAAVKAIAAWRLREAGYVRKWLVLGVVIGIVAGVGAIVFYDALQLATRLVLTGLGGYTPPSTVGEGSGAGEVLSSRPWLIPALVAAGGLVSGVLVFWLAPEAEGHGTDAAIAAIHHHPTSLRARAAAVKIVTSAITIGSGGSGGREGPTAQISATFASALARRLNLTQADARIAVSAGMASGIAAIFRAPLGGALLGAELLYRDDLEAEALLPSLVSSIVAFAIFGSVHGFDPIFGTLNGNQFTHVKQLLGFAILGLAAGLVARLYAVCFYRGGDLIRRIRLPRAVLPALGGLVVGLIGLLVPAVLGTGYGWAQQEMSTPGLLSLPLWLVIVIPFAKIAATTLSIGSGGSGGIFGPGMVIGAGTGAALWRLFEGWFPGTPTSPAPFVIVGMIACFGSVAHAPLAVMLMVGEMTGNLSLLAPAMVAVALATFAVGNTSIYTSQLATRADSPAARLRQALSPATQLRVQQILAPPRLLLRTDMSIRDAQEALLQAVVPGAPVVGPAGVFQGVVALSDIVAAAEESRPVAAVMSRGAPTLPLDAGLDAAAEAVATAEQGWATVLDDDRRPVGIVAAKELVAGYRLSLRTMLRRLHGSGSSARVVELQVAASAPAAGRSVKELSLPRGTAIVSLQQGSHLITPDGDSVIAPLSVVTVLVPAAAEAALRELFTEAAVPRRDAGREAEPATSALS